MHNIQICGRDGEGGRRKDLNCYGMRAEPACTRVRTHVRTHTHTPFYKGKTLLKCQLCINLDVSRYIFSFHVQHNYHFNASIRMFYNPLKCMFLPTGRTPHHRKYQNSIGFGCPHECPVKDISQPAMHSEVPKSWSTGCKCACACVCACVYVWCDAKEVACFLISSSPFPLTENQQEVKQAPLTQRMRVSFLMRRQSCLASLRHNIS